MPRPATPTSRPGASSWPTMGCRRIAATTTWSSGRSPRRSQSTALALPARASLTPASVGGVEDERGQLFEQA
eukprot:15452946-Alexandrium_andersonii.AAC.1